MILHLSRDYAPRSVGGLSSAVPPIVEAAQQQGLQSAVLSFDAWRPSRSAAQHPPRVERVSGVEVVRVDMQTSVELAFERACAMHPTHVQVHHEMLWPLGRAVAVASGASTSLAVHVWQPHNNAARGVDVPTMSLVAQQQAVVEADVVCAPSPATADAVARAAGRTVALAPLALQAAWFEAPLAASDPRRIVFAGRFDATKALDELLDAVARLRTPAELHVAGGLPHNPKLERRARAKLELAPRTVFCDWLDPVALRDLFDSAHVVANPSHVETFGLVTAQALVRGAVVVARPVGLAATVTDDPALMVVAPGAPLDRALEAALGRPRPGRAARAPLTATLTPAAVLPAWTRVWSHRSSR